MVDEVVKMRVCLVCASSIKRCVMFRVQSSIKAACNPSWAPIPSADSLPDQTAHRGGHGAGIYWILRLCRQSKHRIVANLAEKLVSWTSYVESAGDLLSGGKLWLIGGPFARSRGSCLRKRNISINCTDA